MKRDGRIPDLVSVTEAAELLGITRQAVLKMVSRDQLPGARIGTTYVFRRSVITRLTH